MSRAREAFVLPFLFLTVALLGGVRLADRIVLLPPPLFTLVLAFLLVGVLVRSGALAPERLMSAARPPLANISGAVVIVSSPHGQIAFPNCMAYNMAKAALDQMAKTAATELLSHKIRVNCVYPGWTDTPGERKFITDEAIAKAAPGLPWGRLATSEEIAGAIRFLLEPGADYITGTILHIDGGLFLPWWSKRGSGDL